MKFSIGDLVKRILREAWERKKIVAAVYLVTAFSFLVLAWVWPRVYTSSSVILVDQQDILSPLMEGTAVTSSSVIDRAKMARQVIFSRESMLKIIDAGEFFDEEPTPVQMDLQVEEIKSKTNFSNSGKNLIEIRFSDLDPERAFNVAKTMTSIFVDDTIKAKQAESRAAYEFINNEVNNYHKKLQAVELAIKEFRSRNIDSSAPGSKTVTNDRLLELKRQLENINLEIHSEDSKLLARRRQLSGEGTGISSSSLARESALNQRIVNLESRLDTLRLDYHDTFPDIVQIKSQIATLKKQIVEEIESRKTGAYEELKEGPIYQEVRSQVLRIQTNISTLKSRRDQIQKMYDKEAETMSKINAVDAELAELTRDYTVNQELYQDLSRRRESAKISMNIDLENQGLSIKVQENATLPVVPKGIRFAHIILAGLVLSFGAPLVLVYGLSLIDNKVRDEHVVTDSLMLPVLASVYYVNTPRERRSNYISSSIMVMIVLVVWSVYGYAIWLRMNG
ncbi:XrtA system polysaccharide chain length determinant [Aliikangiella coralliicola]|uniref:Polysaccharide chain length determinant N-terminal domain-containing protein n=1 Tax=Aliikangiella coralliicola TaxID=2592383 RepID=A0A545UHD9_9GAMM|nr:XrtA system polysaccharide chain length determinant [Aliikangiella coralliicola]TQV88878.1 hypothetical protein FLL46_04915 [Aliikangiella coralliicola]